MNKEYLAGKLRLVRYLITRADEKGFTHGEKHYLLQSVLILLRELQGEIDPGSVLGIERNQVEDLRNDDIGEIPW